MGLKNDMNDKDIEITEYLEAETARGWAFTVNNRIQLAKDAASPEPNMEKIRNANYRLHHNYCISNHPIVDMVERGVE